MISELTVKAYTKEQLEILVVRYHDAIQEAINMLEGKTYRGEDYAYSVLVHALKEH